MLYYFNRIMAIAWILFIGAGLIGHTLRIADSGFWAIFDGFAVYTWWFVSNMVVYAWVTNQVEFKWSWRSRKKRKK